MEAFLTDRTWHDVEKWPTLTSDSLGPSASPLVITFHTHLGWKEEEEGRAREGESVSEKRKQKRRCRKKRKRRETISDHFSLLSLHFPTHQQLIALPLFQRSCYHNSHSECSQWNTPEVTQRDDHICNSPRTALRHPSSPISQKNPFCSYCPAHVQRETERKASRYAAENKPCCLSYVWTPHTHLSSLSL